MSCVLSILTVSTLYPNAVQRAHGIFVETRLRKLVETGQARAHVLAPVPWMPPLVRYGTNGALRDVPAREERHGLIIEHPRYLVVPKVGMNLTPHTLYRAMRRRYRTLVGQGHSFDLIDAHYFYPDGVAAAWLAREAGLPVVITARGTDLSLIPKFPAPRRMIVEAARHAGGLITVCRALKDSLVELGIPAEGVTVLRNGVDLALFRPLDRQVARAALGLTRRTLVSVGLLIGRKGHHHIIRALKDMPDTDLLIAGSGPDRAALEGLAAGEGVSGRVRFLGSVDQARLCEIYNAADALVLASSREGWANVLLEAMACGTPVVASAVWGTPEVVAAPEAGVLMPSLDAEGVVQGVRELFKNYPDHQATRRYAEDFGWDPTTSGQLTLFRNILERRAQR
ncbi:MAG: glycosyltransferase family 4 protein [Alphaproteobacteria bacterium]|nr:glycosyltransferase family 4 protein [Alphaproteobacteria bacterium]MBN9568341.1 glycosyltransferase family 4 protein [Alphaproteobacteria bacterium]OJU56722.1 MAG: glycosyl transferase family 1 [Alphaproteobacteria bacterium 62-8]